MTPAHEPASSAVNVPCPAKINLTLSVGPPGADGLHPICSWMVGVTLFDELTVRRTTGESQFDIGWSSDAPRPGRVDWPIEKDLTYNTHRLLEQHVGRKLPTEAVLRKRVPAGAGMGGGSSDAAGMLKALNTLFDLHLPHAAMVQFASRLGSDVAFFLGPPSAIIAGLGERCDPAPLERPIYMTLILPDLHCDTAAVYRKFDELRPDARLRVITPQRKAEGVLTNDLADAALAVEPRLRRLRDLCVTATGKSVHITGSGAAMFTVHPDAAAAALTARLVRERCGVPAVTVRTIEPR